jgi:hypothetical protein
VYGGLARRFTRRTGNAGGIVCQFAAVSAVAAAWRAIGSLGLRSDVHVARYHEIQTGVRSR